MGILIGKALKHFYKSNIILTWTLKKNTISNFLLYTYYRNIYQQERKLI